MRQIITQIERSQAADLERSGLKDEQISVLEISSDGYQSSLVEDKMLVPDCLLHRLLDQVCIRAMRLKIRHADRLDHFRWQGLASALSGKRG